MSEVENALTGAEVAPVENTAPLPEQTQANGSESTTEQDVPKEEQPRDDKGRFVQQRINELTRNWRSAERERDHYRQQLESYSQQQPQRTQHSEQPPSIGSFQSVEEWGAALAEYSARRALSEAEQRFQQHDQQRQHQTIAQAFEEKERAFAQTAPDYYERVSELASVVNFSQPIIEALAASDHSAAIAYHLANHLDEADRIARMPPHIAAVQIGRIEAQVSAPKPAKPVTKAPDPVPKVGGASAAPRGLADELPVDEWMSRRTAKL